jgi:hypothetical protein
MAASSSRTGEALRGHALLISAFAHHLNGEAEIWLGKRPERGTLCVTKATTHPRRQLKTHTHTHTHISAKGRKLS